MLNSLAEANLLVALEVAEAHMRKWGLVVSVFYAGAVILLLVPLVVALVGDWHSVGDLHRHIVEAYGYWATWLFVGVFIAGQVLLLVLSVDVTERRLKPRTHVLLSALVAGLFLAVLTSAAVLSIAAALRGDNLSEWMAHILRWLPPVAWILWGIVFYRYSRGEDDSVNRAVSWLLRGSVLELLIAVPSHVIVRRRDDCCAPLGTGIGIASGIAIMLLAFGTSVVFLYKRRMDGLKPKLRLPSRQSVRADFARRFPHW